ncbi:MAG: 2-succinyl-5-enolpyruvyl-6-hydroxy-3-cyclohexene-1-carboxylic-acid synthase [Tannerellaceae bacterium]|jgi:2-succinyl-5-enolpyruvyl-6-hydroxy-3-cyclohexene-1-carboxylate synthase|nr:2-succinyl-5-enolpyruvyl-6-hydroxy-3-cyclohexene-1-carboxylic-acid synthase [Tannerellaceae bacterium]
MAGNGKQTANHVINPFIKIAMYSSKKNILQLVSLLKAHRVKHLVLSPGSRNAPVIQSLANDDFFCCHTVVDERSAGFYAIGIAQYTGRPTALCCTSGTAVLNYGPALAEAFYQQIPLIFITADRPAAQIDQLLGQTLPQPGIFGPLAKKSVHLPEITSGQDFWFCNRLINEALLEATHRQPGPVHINLPLSEPLFEYEDIDPPPPARIISRYEPEPTSFHPYGERFRNFRRPLLLVGQQTDGELLQPLCELQNRHHCVVLAEHPANLPASYFIRNFDALLFSLSENEQPLYAPDLLLTVGGHLVSKRIHRFFRDNPTKEHWHISADGKIVDTYRRLTDVIETKAAPFLAYLAGQKEREPSPAADENTFFRQWHFRSRQIPEPTGAYSDLMAAGALMKALPENACLQLANSSSVRLAQLFRPAAERLRIFSNRGTNGIDGCLSTAVGQAGVNPDLTFLLIGDLAFFYDMNILWNRPLVPGLRILLNNNQGGEIFYTLPGFVASPQTEKHIAMRHTETACDWATSRGLIYLSAHNRQSLEDAMPAFVDRRTEQPMLLEVFTSPEENAKTLLRYNLSLKGR